MDSAHGGGMFRREDPSELFSEAWEDAVTLARLYAFLGRKPPLPEWMKAALSAGWTPPTGFDRSAYEE